MGEDELIVEIAPKTCSAFSSLCSHVLQEEMRQEINKCCALIHVKTVRMYKRRSRQAKEWNKMIW